MKRFDGKNILITGGTRGIGRAIVEAFANEGGNVFFTYKKSADIANELSTNFSAKGFCVDQADFLQIEKCIDEINQQHGGIDILVNNAGITRDQYIIMMTNEEWNTVLQTNLTAVWYWCKFGVRSIISRGGGSIVNISSVAGLIGIGGQTNYAASKGGILAMTRALAAEVGAKKVRVNSVVPGFIETEMTAKIPRNIKRTNLERILLKRFGKPEEVAKTVLFLASDDASYIVGQQLIVDGGLTATVV